MAAQEPAGQTANGETDRGQTGRWPDEGSSAAPIPHGLWGQPPANGGSATGGPANGGRTTPGPWDAMLWPGARQGAPEGGSPVGVVPNGAAPPVAPDGYLPPVAQPVPDRPAPPAGYPTTGWGPGYGADNGRGGGSAPPSPAGRRIPARAALVAIPGALLGIVLANVGAAIGLGITGSTTSGVSDVLGEAGLWAAMLATVVYVSHRFGTASLVRDYGLGIRPRDPLFGLGAAFTAFVLAGLVLAVFSGTRFSGSNTQILSQQKGNGVGFVLVTLLVALGAPFFEELFFRGYLRTALQDRFGSHGAVWLQAGFFGLAHAGEANTAFGNVSVVLAMFTVGVVLGYTAKLTGRLGAGMVAHGLFNLVAVISLL